MRLTRSVLPVLTVLVLLAGAGVAFAFGVGPAPGGESGTDIESFPTESSASSGEVGTADGTATPTGPPFTSTIERIEACGETCRDVTITLTNSQSTAASNVTVYTRVYAGNGTDGDVVWEGVEPVGDTDAGESYTATERVELSIAAAYTVRQQDGWVTVRTTVTSEGETVTVTDRRRMT